MRKAEGEDHGNTCLYQGSMKQKNAIYSSSLSLDEPRLIRWCPVALPDEAAPSSVAFAGN